MSEFEVIGLEFVEPVKKYNLNTKEKFIEFFMIYYEYSFYDEFMAELFETVPELKSFLMKTLDEVCVGLTIDYEKDYATFSDEVIKKLWWSLQLALTEELFKETRPASVLNTISKLRTALFKLSVETLEVQMLFVNILLDETPFSPRPIFNVSAYGCNFESVKNGFMKVYKENAKSFSLRKMKNCLIFPYELTSKYLTDDEIFYDLFIMFIFEVIPLDETEDEDKLSEPIIAYLNEVCPVNKVTDKLTQKLIDISIKFAHDVSDVLNKEDDD